jgi:hypothetical protein
VFIAWPYLFPPGTPLLDVVNMVVKLRSPILHYAPDPGGIGAMPAQEIVRRIKGRPLLRGQKRVWWLRQSTNSTKVASHGFKRWLLENRQVILPREPQTLRQFQGMRFEAAAHGGTIENANPAVHDDIPAAAALTMLAHVPEGGGRVICGLQSLAGETAVPEAPVEPLDLDVVETGGGLKVYRQPVLQSVAGQHISLPTGARPAVYRDTKYDHVREALRARKTHTR